MMANVNTGFAMTTILLSPGGPGPSSEFDTYLFALIVLVGVWIIGSWLGIIAGAITGLVCACYMRGVSPALGILSGLACGALAGCAAAYFILIRESILPEMLFSGLASAALTLVICSSIKWRRRSYA